MHFPDKNFSMFSLFELIIILVIFISDVFALLDVVR